MRFIVIPRIRAYPPNRLKIPLITFSPSLTIGFSKRKLSIPDSGALVVVGSVNSGRNVCLVVDVDVVFVVVKVDFLLDLPKKKAIVDFSVVVVVVVLKDDMMEVGNLRSLVLDVVDGVGRSRVVASSSLVRLPSWSRGCWVVVSSFRKLLSIYCQVQVQIPKTKITNILNIEPYVHCTI